MASDRNGVAIVAGNKALLTKRMAVAGQRHATIVRVDGEDVYLTVSGIPAHRYGCEIEIVSK